VKQLHKIFYALIIIAFAACDGDERSTPVDIESFWPVGIGKYIIYDVEEVVYELGEPDTLRYQLKSVIVDSFQNQEGKPTYLIHRFTRVSEGQEWQPSATWSASVDASEAVVMVENQPYVALSAPLVKGTTWDGNKYSTGGGTGGTTEDFFEVEAAGVDLVINNTLFKNCLSVKQEDNQEYIVFFDQRFEVYCKGIGLVEKRLTQLSYCNDQDLGCVGQQKVDEGIIFTQRILSHGTE
jgi:hypothetical protein